MRFERQAGASRLPQRAWQRNIIHVRASVAIAAASFGECKNDLQGQSLAIVYSAGRLFPTIFAAFAIFCSKI
jgi:hypothetical protein